MDREVVHIVLFRWKPGTSAAQRDAAHAALRGLATAIPGIVDLTCGPNFTDRAKGFETGLVVRFVNRKALEAYLPHPAHRRVVDEVINPIREDSLALDYEVEA
ncbi:MAG: Dabb family protein [Chthonomonadales bacterium]|nr:Dabb family protein [Chthonomonadales bacterium]